jgi:hypothetical protein
MPPSSGGLAVFFFFNFLLTAGMSSDMPPEPKTLATLVSDFSFGAFFTIARAISDPPTVLTAAATRAIFRNFFLQLTRVPFLS